MEIIENTKEAIEEFGFCDGVYHFTLDNDEVVALLNGKCLAATVGMAEYAIFISIKNARRNLVIVKRS